MTAWREAAACFGPGGGLIGIHTRPQGEDATRPSVLFINAGILHRVGPNRMHVELARLLAERGHRVLRFDLAGIGDSAARSDGLLLGEGVRRDVDAALAELRLDGPRAVVVVGLCSGADNALRAAARDPEVVGAVLMDPTVFRTAEWYLHRGAEHLSRPGRLPALLDHPRIARALARLRGGTAESAEAEGRPEFFYTGYRTREEVEAALQRVLARRVQLFYAFTGGWADIYNYETQLLDNHPGLPFRGALRLRWYPEADHTYTRRALRERFFKDLLAWFHSAPFPREEPHERR